jgi:hypothetical protein
VKPDVKKKISNGIYCSHLSESPSGWSLFHKQSRLLEHIPFHHFVLLVRIWKNACFALFSQSEGGDAGHGVLAMIKDMGFRKMICIYFGSIVKHTISNRK